MLSREIASGAVEATAAEAESRALIPDLYRLAVAVLQDPDAAADAVQEGLRDAWQSWDSVRDPTLRHAWLRRIVLRRSLRRRSWTRRQHARERPLDGSDMAQGEEVADPALEAALIDLTARQRAVIVRHFQYEYTLDECADLMGCRPGTARSHLARALAGLRENLGHE